MKSSEADHFSYYSDAHQHKIKLWLMNFAIAYDGEITAFNNPSGVSISKLFAAQRRISK
jgi:hypothetical protein